MSATVDLMGLMDRSKIVNHTGNCNGVIGSVRDTMKPVVAATGIDNIPELDTVPWTPL